MPSAPVQPRTTIEAIAEIFEFRVGIPDLRCEIEQMIVAGDRVAVHLRFRSHFDGRFKDTKARA